MILSFLGFAALVSASAEITETPRLFLEDFTGTDRIPEGWVQYGASAEPTGSYANYFSNYGSGNYFTVFNPGLRAAYSPSEFSGGTPSDQWLITPEITIDDAEVLLTYSVGILGSNSKNKFKVLVSEGGTAKEDFTKSLSSTSITGKGATFHSIDKRTVIEGYAGKKIRLAFVNNENTSGILGFGKFMLSQYDLTMEENFANHYVVYSDTFKPSFSFKLSTPTSSPGVTAVLTTDNGYSSAISNTYAFGSGMASSCTIEFPDQMTMDRSVVNFTLEITPNFEGAHTSVIKGQFIHAPYKGIAVMEEYTGTWCGYCPSGAAVLAYYKDTYGIHKGGGFVGVAIHGADVMQPSFYEAIQGVIPTNSFPWVFLNRGTNAMPESVNPLSLLNTPLPVNVRISRVDYDPSSSKIAVNFGTAVVYDTEDPGYNAFVYILENDVQGTGTSYAQTNNYRSRDEDWVKINFGEEFIPYFKPFIYPSTNPIPAENMKFQDVARGVAPSVTGRPLSGPMKMCVYNKDCINTKMPSSVMKKENTEVVVILTDASTNKIIAADAVDFKDFNKDVFEILDGPMYPEGFDPTTEVKEVQVKGTVSVANGTIVVNTPVEGQLDVYSIEGQRLMSNRVDEGTSTLRPAHHGLVIIRLATPDGIVTRKAIL